MSEWLSWESWATRESFGSRQSHEIFFFIKTSTPVVGPTFLLFSGYWGAITPGKSGQGVKPSIHLCLLSRLKMALSYTFPHMSLWRAQELTLNVCQSYGVIFQKIGGCVSTSKRSVWNAWFVSEVETWLQVREKRADWRMRTVPLCIWWLSLTVPWVAEWREFWRGVGWGRVEL